ncbi:MAG: xylulokinase [Spirochaetes bacterium]|nr:xylulokinase [Spirochaetota bacterium]
MRTICGIDLGTQSLKVILYDPEARKTLVSAQASLDMTARDDGTREQEASWYGKALADCFAALPEALRSTITAIGVSGQQHGFVPLDGEGKPLRPVKLWCDTSTVAECAELTARAGGQGALLAGTGILMLPGYTAPKILWLKNHEPENFARLAQVLLPHDYMNFLLTGEYWMECGDASGTALLDVRKRAWSSWACGLIDPGLLDLLPRLVPPDAPAGRVSAAASRLYGIPEGALVAPGGGDNMMGAIGTGTVRDGFLTMSLGTSGTLYGHSSSPIVDPEGSLAAFCSSTGDWLPLLCTMNCTVASEKVRALLGLDLARFNALAAKAPIGSEGLVVLPFFNGERVPNLPSGRASVQGGTLVNFTAGNFARAAMESAIFGMKTGLEAFEAQGFSAREIRVTGGGAKSLLWRKIAAEVMDLPVLVPAGKESAAMGAALQALLCAERASGASISIAELVDAHIVMENASALFPHHQSVLQYEAAYEGYKRYLGALSPLYR